MKTVHKSVLIWFSAEEMFALVTGVARYPEFLPWCDRASVLETHADGATAQVGMTFGGFHKSFTTRNVHDEGRSVTVQLVDGPFSLLQGTWLFKQLGRPGSEQPANARRYSYAATLEILPE